jgi:hypothetical protein
MNSRSPNQKNPAHLQEQILIGAADRVTIVHLIDLDGLQNGRHHELAQHLEREFRRVELIDDWYRLTRNSSRCFYNWRCIR